MTNVFALSFTLLLFVAVMIIITREEWDYVAYSMLAALLACLITGYAYNMTMGDFIDFIEFRPIIFIFSMQIIVLIAERHKIFQWIALKALHLTRGNHRLFLYLICTISTLSATILADVTVAIIFVPLVIRASKILKIDASPYIYGISFTVNIGSLYTPFSSSENILISNAYNLTFNWFIITFTLFVFPTLFITLFLLDRFMLRKIPPPSERDKKILMEIMQPDLVIVDRKQFVRNFIYFIAVIVGFILVPEAYLVALAGAIIIALLNKTPITEYMRDVDWKLILFLISLFLLIGCLDINGIFKTIGELSREGIPNNVFWASLILLFIIAGVSGFLAQAPTAIIFITLLRDLFPNGVPELAIVAFLFGINLGSNFLPQGAAADLMCLNLAQKNNVEGFTYKALAVNGAKMTLVHLILCVLYMLFYYLVTGGVGTV